MRRIWSLVLLLPNETFSAQALLQLHTFTSKTVTYCIRSFHICFSYGLGSSMPPSTAYGGQLLRRREVVICNSYPLFMVEIWRDDIFQGKWNSNRIWPRMNFLPKPKVVDVSAKRTSFCLPLESGLGKYMGLFWIETRVLTWSRKALPVLASAMEMCTLAEARKRSGGAWVCRLPRMQ